MNIQTIKQQLPEYAKDTKLNLSRVLSADGSDGLTATQVFSIALASAYATRNANLSTAIIDEAADRLSGADIEAAKGAATIMAMNNIYYRFTHLVSDKDYASMPANVRMSIIGKPGVDKVSFELMSLAVSAINGCGMCMDAHVGEVHRAQVSKQGVQTTIRIASVIAAAAQALAIEAPLAGASSASASELSVAV